MGGRLRPGGEVGAVAVSIGQNQSGMSMRRELMFILKKRSLLQKNYHNIRSIPISYRCSNFVIIAIILIQSYFSNSFVEFTSKYDITVLHKINSNLWLYHHDGKSLREQREPENGSIYIQWSHLFTVLYQD